MKHCWLNLRTWAQARKDLRDLIIQTFQITKRRVVYEDLSENTDIPPYALDFMLCQIAAKDYQLGRARADTVVTRRNELLPRDGYFNFRLNSKKLSLDQDREQFYENELALCCQEFGVQLKPGAIQLELWEEKPRNLIPLDEMEKRSPGILKQLKHSGRHYRQALPPKTTKKEKKKLRQKKE